MSADRLARVARIRALQKRQALGKQAQLIAQRGSLTTMLGRVDTLRAVYMPKAGEADSLLLKGMAHQHGRLQRPRDATLAQTKVVDGRLDEARTVTLSAHIRLRAAEELESRAAARDRRDAERRADRQPPLARALLGSVR